MNKKISAERPDSKEPRSAERPEGTQSGLRAGARERESGKKSSERSERGSERYKKSCVAGKPERNRERSEFHEQRGLRTRSELGSERYKKSCVAGKPERNRERSEFHEQRGLRTRSELGSERYKKQRSERSELGSERYKKQRSERSELGSERYKKPRSAHAHAHGSYSRRERHLLRASFVMFLVLHLAALLVIPLFKPPVPEPDEISIDIDLLPDSLALDQAPTTEPPELVNILPQLPKKFTLQKPLPLPIDPEPAPKLAEHKPAPKDKPPVEDPIERTSLNEENVLKVNEALQRLALEKLRSQQHKEKKRDANISSKMQKVIANVSRLKNSGTLAANYQTVLRVAIKRNFILPDIYDLKNANIKVKLEIRIDARGNLLRMRVIKSSRNRIFDDLAMAAVRNTSPFPIPPSELVDKQIIVILTPLMTG